MCPRKMRMVGSLSQTGLRQVHQECVQLQAPGDLEREAGSHGRPQGLAPVICGREMGVYLRSSPFLV